jgi:predicted RNA-binding protein with TRAM domain
MIKERESYELKIEDNEYGGAGNRQSRGMTVFVAALSSVMV